MKLLFRLAVSRGDVLRCRRVAAEVYNRDYEVVFSEDHYDLEAKIEPWPHRFLMAWHGDELVAACGLYMRDTYVEKFGQVSDDEVFAYNFDDRETAANVLSTAINELIENVVKFSEDKGRPSRVRVLQFDDYVRVETTNGTSAEQARVFAGVLERIVTADPEELFAALVAAPPPTGGPGIGLVMLRKDYSAELAVRIDAATDGRGHDVEIHVSISNGEIEQR